MPASRFASDPEQVSAFVRGGRPTLRGAGPRSIAFEDGVAMTATAMFFYDPATAAVAGATVLEAREDDATLGSLPWLRHRRFR